MSEPLLIGIDEGTTAVKAVLFDARLRALREARRRKQSRHPHPGWVEQDARHILDTVVDAVAELLAGAPGEVVARGLDHQGESVLAWDAESGEPLSPAIVWQDKRTQPILDALAAEADAISARSGLPLDPYFSSSKLTWLLEHDGAVGAARERGTLRLGNVDAGRPTGSAGSSPPTRRPRRARSCTASATRAGTSGCAIASASPRRSCPRCATASARSARCATRAGRRSWR